MGYIITENLFSAAEAGQRIGQARQVEQSSAMNLLQSLKGVTNTAYTVVADEFNKEMKIQEEVDNEKGVTQGTIDVSPEQYAVDTQEGHTAYDKAYNKAQQAQVAANVSVLARTRTAELAQQFAQDPDNFKGATVGLFESITEEYGFQPEMQSVLFKELTSEMGRYLPSIAAKGYQKQKADQFAAQTAEYDTLTNVGLNTVRSGNLDKYTEDRDNVIDRLTIMRNEGQITQKQYNESVNTFDKEASSQLAIGSVERSLEVNDLDTAIAERDSWVKDMQESGLLSPDEIDRESSRLNSMIASKHKELAKLYKQNEEVAVSRDLVQEALESGVPLDYKNSVDKKAVNTSWESQTVKKDAAGNVISEFKFEDPRQREAAIQFSLATGVIPEKVIKSMRTSMYSIDPDIAMRGVDMYMRFSETNPEFTKQMSDKDMAYAEKITGLVGSGMEIDVAVEQSKQFYAQEFQVRQEAAIKSIGSTQDMNDLVNKNVDSYIDEAFDVTLIASQPDAPAMLTGDYERLLKHNLGMTGDLESADSLTKKQLSQKWGNTWKDGEQTLVAFAPEQVLAGSREEVSWITNDWNETAAQVAEEKGVAATDVVYQADQVTYRGEKAWKIYYKDAGGIMVPYAQGKEGYWTVNYKDTPEAKEAELRKAEEVSEAQYERERRNKLDNIKKTNPELFKRSQGFYGF